MSGDNLRLDFSSSRSTGGAGAPTLTTPTLTPTTLRNIEQMFLDHESSTILDCPPSPPEVHENAAHFVPPYVALTKTEDGVSLKEESPQVNNEAWDAGIKKETDLKTSLYLNSSSNIFQCTSSPSTMSADPQIGSAARQLPPDVSLRLQMDYSSMPTLESSRMPRLSPIHAGESSGASSGSSSGAPVAGPSNDDEKRRLLRRQRNKEAAARCRKRRLDQTLTLQDEVDKWEERNNNHRKEIEALENQKRQLAVLLEGHRNSGCKIAKNL